MTLATTSPDYMGAASTGGVAYADATGNGWKEVARLNDPAAKVLPSGQLDTVLARSFTDLTQVEIAVKADLGLDQARISANVYIVAGSADVLYATNRTAITAFGLVDQRNPSAGIKVLRPCARSPFRCDRRIAFWITRDVRPCAEHPSTAASPVPLLNHLVGAGEQGAAGASQRKVRAINCACLRTVPNRQISLSCPTMKRGVASEEMAMGAIGAVFQPELIKVMKAVLDDAAATLPESKRTSTMMAEIASQILACAAKGERDPAALKIAALLAVVECTHYSHDIAPERLAV
jgi:hypothetical protein